MALEARKSVDLKMLKSIRDKIYELLHLMACSGVRYLNVFQEDASFKISGGKLSKLTRRHVDKIILL